MLESTEVPGLIEEAEARYLRRLGGHEFVREHGDIVEFGSFFGRSTACLVAGASRWWSPGDRPRVYAYDRFACPEHGATAALVRNFAGQHHLGHLLERRESRLSFEPVYRHFTAPAEAAGLLKTVVGDLSEASFPGERIALMHIDAPKYYGELRHVLFGFFPALVPGAAVVFQDYFYHWSATLVAAAQLLVESGVLRFHSSAASAAVATVLRTPTERDLAALDSAMSAAPVDRLLDRSLAAAAGMKLDRPERFLPRLRLAKAQWLYARGEYVAAEAAIVKMFEEAGGLRADLFEDVRDLIRFGFSLRVVYELDHEVS